MNFYPMGPLNGLPPYFFDPNFKDALTNGHPFPFNVLNQPVYKSEGVHFSNHPGLGHGLLPYDVYNKQPVEPSEEDLEKEYEEIMGKQLQSQQDEDKKPEDSEQGKKKKKKKPKTSAMISFDKLTAGTIQSSSGIFNGKNIQFGWSAHSKTNNGFGTVGGNSNTLRNNINVVFDNDQLDTPIDDRDIMWSPVPTP